MNKMSKTNKKKIFEVYGVDISTKQAKTFTLFGYNTLDVKRFLIKTQPFFDFKAIYPG